MTKEIIRFPRSRGLATAALQLAVKRHIVHGILEADVTLPRLILKNTTGTDGRPLSFTGYLIACYARAIQAHPMVQAFRDVWNRLIVYHEVDVSTYLERRTGGMVIPYTVRNAGARSVREISEELRAAAKNPNLWGNLEKAYNLVSHLPHFLQLLVFKGLALHHPWIKKYFGTTALSSFGMLGKHVGWGIGLLYGHSVGIFVGGIVTKPMAYQGSIALRECLHLTIAVDHDIIDAEPVAQLITDFIDLIESGALLEGEAV